jgi:predicted helicase
MSHSYVDNPTLRGMRQSLGNSFSSINILDLHGNSTKKERSPDGSEDKNVFDIKQGVAILGGVRRDDAAKFAVINYGEAFGTRESKYAFLQKHSFATTDFRRVLPVAPSYLFRPQSTDAREEFNQWPKVTEVFIKGNVGIITARDNMVVDFEAKPLVERAEMFRDSRLSDAALCDTLGISLKKGWDIGRARVLIKRDKELDCYVKPLCYRPFDSRLIFYHPSLVWGMSYPTMQNMLVGGNLAMMVGRAGQVIGGDEWDILFCTRGLSEFNLYRRGGHNLLPLYLIPDNEGSQIKLSRHEHWRPNFSPSFLAALAAALKLPQEGVDRLPASLTPEEMFYYIYSVFHSPAYRSRYAEFLKIDFPRLPLPRSLSTFHALARLGKAMTALHLLESPELDKPLTSYLGPPNPEVERVSYVRNTVWLDKAQTHGFRGVPEATWDFHIGGYQVCEKWLKDRKGRTLSKVDIAHYQNVVVALSETIRLMAEIDKVIEAHGGWPGAFVTSKT